MHKYRRVTCIDRCHIFVALKSGVSISELSKQLGFNKSTIYRELRRNKLSKSYDPIWADKLASERFKRCCRKSKINIELEDLIQYFLFEGWSPEQISGRLKVEGSLTTISHQAIYNFLRVNRTDLLVLLKRYGRFGGGRIKQRKSQLLGRTTIHERSDEIESKSRVGDFERDCMRFSGFKGELLVCTDRKTKFTKIEWVEKMYPKDISKLTLKILKGLKLKSLTNDNGLEFRDGKNMKIPVYYCDPGRPDQRGIIENQIGRLRHDLPLKSNPTTLDLVEIERRHNNTPRKCLDFKTPYEVFYEKNVALVI